MTPGEYYPPVRTIPGAEAKGIVAGKAEAAKPPFNGMVNGIFIWSSFPPSLSEMTANNPNLNRRPCTGNDAHDLPPEDAAENPYYFDVPPYMPPGAWASGPTQVTVCSTGETIHVGRDFNFRPQSGWLGISRNPFVWFARLTHTSKDRIEPATVNGKPAVFVKPVTAEGWGDSAVIVRETWGVTIVDAVDLPFDEVLRVAESME